VIIAKIQDLLLKNNHHAAIIALGPASLITMYHRNSFTASKKNDNAPDASEFSEL